MVYIRAIGLSKVERAYGKGLQEKFYEAVVPIMETTGLSEVDTVIVSNSFASLLQSQNLLAPLLVEDLSLLNVTTLTVENGGAGGLTALHLARSLIKSGESRNVLVVGVEKTTDYNSEYYNAALSQLTNAEFEAIYGANIISQFAIIARAYLERHSVSEELFAEWPVFMHENSLNAKHSQLRFKITVDKVLASDYVSSPLRVLHSPPFGDGAAALLLSGERGEDSLARIEMTAVLNDTMELSLRGDLATLPSVKRLVERLQKKTFPPNQADYIDVLDKYSIAGPLMLETMGIADPGRILYEIKEGKFRPGDKPVINHTGGAKARGHPVGATGVYQVAEAVAAMHGLQGVRGLDYVEKAWILGIGGPGTVAAGAIVKRV